MRNWPALNYHTVSITFSPFLLSLWLREGRSFYIYMKLCTRFDCLEIRHGSESYFRKLLFDVRLESLAFFIFFYFLLKLKLSFVTEGSWLVQSVSANKFKFFTEKVNVFYEYLPRALGPQNFFVITIWNWRLIKICRWYKKQPQIENDFVCYGKK